MNGTVTVVCRKHQARCQLKDGRIWHEVWGAAGYCNEDDFIVRRERETSYQGAMRELELAARARGETTT